MTNKNKNKLFGIVMTVVFHATAIILLFTLCFRTPLPLPGEAGVEVNLGMYAQAMNNEVKETTSQQSNETTNQQVQETASQQEEIEDIVSEDEDVPAIEEETEKPEEEKPEEIIEEKPEEIIEENPEDTIKEQAEEVTEEVPEEVIEEKPVINQRAMFQAPKNNTASSGDNSTTEEGIQGSPNGLKDVERYEGNGGSGDGPAYDLGGRGAKSISTPSKNFSEEGIVVVDIWVDKEGRVQRTEIGKGTTITNTTMRASALEAAKNSIFNNDDNAADLQRGTITYKFIIRQ